jgi:hypothetical protein
MRRAVLPERRRLVTGASRKPTAAPCSSTSSRPCRPRRRTGSASGRIWRNHPDRCIEAGIRRRPNRRCDQRAFADPGRAGAVPRRPSRPPVVRGDHPAAASGPQGDIPLLAEHFGRRMAVELEWSNWPGFTTRISAEMERYPWPGNVRELRNVVERAVYRWEDPERPIDSIQFDPFHSPWAPKGTASAEAPPGDRRGRTPEPVEARPRRLEDAIEVPRRRTISARPSIPTSGRFSRTH